MVGLFTPHSVYGIFMTAQTKQLLAVTAGGIAGALCFVGLTGCWAPPFAALLGVVVVYPLWSWRHHNRIRFWR